jgi:hypothetical protein
VSARDDLDVIDPAPAGSVTLGDGETKVVVVVKALKVGKLPAFARALQPVAGEIDAMFAAGVNAGAVLKLIEQHGEKVFEALEIATGAPKAVIEDSTIDQALELVLAVISANKDFLRGRLTAALQTAAQLKNGAGLTPSKP